jgi:hypothetical protein
MATVRPKVLTRESNFFKLGGSARDKLSTHNLLIVRGERNANSSQSVSLPLVLFAQPIIYNSVEINDFGIAQIGRVDLVATAKQSLA